METFEIVPSEHNGRIGKCIKCGAQIVYYMTRQGGRISGLRQFDNVDTLHVCKEKEVVKEVVKEVSTGIDLATVKELVGAQIAATTGELIGEVETLKTRVAEIETTKEITIVTRDDSGETRRNIGRQHKSFETLLTMAGQARVNTMLVGPAGSFKTTATSALAKALNLSFYHVSFGQATTKGDILGQPNIGEHPYVPSQLRLAYEHGGVCCLDEIDCISPAGTAYLNAILSNGVVGFPDGVVPRHPDFIPVATANTYGRGADSQYIGRAQLDAATLNRWRKLYWDYDWPLIHEIAAGIAHDNGAWSSYVERLTTKAISQSLRVVLGARIAIDGAKMLAAGMPVETVKEIAVFAEMGTDDAAKLKAVI